MNSQERSEENKNNKILHSNMSSDDGVFKFDFMTSLQSISKAKIMTTIFMNQMIGQTKKVSAKDFLPLISQLPLPDSIIREIIPLVSHLPSSITRWISYYDGFLLKTKRDSAFRASDFINNITWTNRAKIDYVQTAKNVLINQKSLTDEQKYKIACSFCLEEEIAVFGAKVINPNYLDSVKIEMNPMVYFWTMHITSGNSNFDHYRSLSHEYSSINEHVMQLLIQFCGRYANFEVPLRYVWNKLSKEEKAKNIDSVMAQEFTNLTCSLLSDLNYEQQNEVFKNCSRKILESIIHDWSWENYFLPTALHVLRIIDPKDFFGILLLVVRKAKDTFSEDCNLLSNKYKDIFKQLYKASSQNLRDSFIERSDCFLTCELSWEQDLDIIDFIFEDLNSNQKKNIIFGYYGINCCTKFIKKNQWDLLELFIKYTLTSEEDIILLKQRFKGDRGVHIAVNFLVQRALNDRDYFMNWVFKSEEEIDEFKQSLAHANYDVILKSIIKENDVDFTFLENHFRWCAKEEPQLINKFKAEAPRYLISDLLENSQFELVDQILNWCLENQEQIVRFKSNMYEDDHLSRAIISLISSLLEKDCPFTILNGFVSWSFANEQEIQEFKMWLLYPQIEKYSVCTDLLKTFQFDLADNFITWCGIPFEAVEEIKNALMLSFEDMRYILYNRTCTGYAESYSESKMQLLIKWFNPSRETVQKCKAFLVSSLPHMFSKFYKELIDYESKNFTSHYELK